jgi:hypothetical protein
MPSPTESATARALRAELQRPATRAAVDAYIADREHIAEMIKKFKPPTAITGIEQALKQLSVAPKSVDVAKIALPLASMDFGSNAAVRQAVAGLDLGSNSVFRQAVAGLDLGGAAAYRQAVAGLDIGGSAALRQAVAGLDLGGAAAVRQAIAGLDLGSAKAASQALAAFAGR